MPRLPSNACYASKWKRHGWTTDDDGSLISDHRLDEGTSSIRSCTAANVLQIYAFLQTCRLQLSSPQTEMHWYVQAADVHKPEKWGWRKSSGGFWGLLKTRMMVVI